MTGPVPYTRDRSTRRHLLTSRVFAGISMIREKKCPQKVVHHQKKSSIDLKTLVDFVNVQLEIEKLSFFENILRPQIFNQITMLRLCQVQQLT